MHSLLHALSKEELLPRLKQGVLELSTVGCYNLNCWMSLGVGVGYRFMFGLADEIRDVYESPITLTLVRIHAGKLTKSN